MKIVVDDTILVQGQKCTCGADALFSASAIMDAELVKRLKDAGHEVTALRLTEEFGLGQDSEGAELVAAGMYDAAIGIDCNGAGRIASAYSGAVCIKPTYGVISRYGTAPVADSGETICITAGNAVQCADLLTTMAGADERDEGSLPWPAYGFTAMGTAKGKKIAVAGKAGQFGQVMKALGAQVTELELPEFQYAQAAWQILLCAECYGNLRRLPQPELLDFSTKCFLLYGATLNAPEQAALVDKARRVRRLLREKLDALFAEYDMLASGDVALPLLTGVPAIVSCGMQLLANDLGENKLLGAAADIQEYLARQYQGEA